MTLLIQGSRLDFFLLDLLLWINLMYVNLGGKKEEKKKWMHLPQNLGRCFLFWPDFPLNPWRISQQQVSSKVIHSHQNFRFIWPLLSNRKQLHPAITKSIVSASMLFFTIQVLLRKQLATKSLCSQHIRSNPLILQKDLQFTCACLILLHRVVLLIVNFKFLWGFIVIPIDEFCSYWEVQLGLRKSCK